jgi:DNA-directed RNA polymerase subunit RPC12/RpoP
MASKGFGQGANDVVTCPKCGGRFFSKGFPRHAKKCERAVPEHAHSAHQEAK